MLQLQKANPCLKTIFYAFNGLLGIAGCLVFSLAVAFLRYRDSIAIANGLDVYVMAVGMISLSILGIVGARKESVVCLGVFLVLMTVGALVMFIRSIQFSLIASQFVDVVIRAILGVAIGLFGYAVLGVILSLCLLRQIGGSADYMKPAAIPDWATVPNHDVPKMHEPLINSVPMSSIYPSLA